MIPAAVPAGITCAAGARHVHPVGGDMMRCRFLVFFLFILSAGFSGGDLYAGTSGFTRSDVTFTSEGKKCVAWLYLPDGVAKPPVVVMAHGFGAERVLRLDAYAEKFVRRGMACFVFEYRGFGASEGEPRNHISPSKHLEDWQAAISRVRRMEEVDAGRMGLWGTSFSGGHVIVTAAKTNGIAAIVAQVPFVDGVSSGFYGPVSFQIKAFFHGLGDVFTAVFTLGKKRHTVPIVANPQDFGMLNTPDSMPGFYKLAPAGYKPDNRCPAIIALTLPLYRPISYAKKVRCPAFIICSEKDSLIPPKAVKKTASLIKNATLVSLPVGHFDIYTGELFEKYAGMEADFLSKHLKAGAKRK
jgi:pimeloyl-ACP methyl ester carboxylesterase